MNQFEKMGIDEDFNPFYDEFNITGPTDVQAKVIPKIMRSFLVRGSPDLVFGILREFLTAALF